MILSRRRAWRPKSSGRRATPARSTRIPMPPAPRQRPAKFQDSVALTSKHGVSKPGPRASHRVRRRPVEAIAGRVRQRSNDSAFVAPIACDRHSRRPCDTNSRGPWCRRRPGHPRLQQRSTHEERDAIDSSKRAPRPYANIAAPSRRAAPARPAFSRRSVAPRMTTSCGTGNCACAKYQRHPRIAVEYFYC